jgi:hypothetical protein
VVKTLRAGIGLVDPTVSPLVAAVDRSACAQIS